MLVGAYDGAETHAHLVWAVEGFCHRVAVSSLADRDYLDELDERGRELIEAASESGDHDLVADLGAALARVRRARATAG